MISIYAKSLFNHQYNLRHNLYLQLKHNISITKRNIMTTSMYTITKVSKPIIIFTNKRFMFRICTKVLPFTISLIPRTTPKFFTRYPSLVAEGTMLVKNEYQDLKKILYLHNKYLLHLNCLEDIDVQSFQFYQNVMLLNPKLFQHILSIAYPDAKYPVSKLREFYPELNIDGGKADLLVTEDVVIATTAANIIKQNPIFKKGSLTVLAADYDPEIKKEKLNELAISQTKQEHPDYYFYKPIDENSGVWHRYYDFKTGKFNINNGHIICMSNKEQYEKEVGHHLHAQWKMYKTNYKIIDKEYSKIINNPNLTWSERNNQIQEYFRDNLHHFPKINPSFIIYNPLIYQIDNECIPKGAIPYVIESCIENVENTEKMVAVTIYNGGNTVRNNYINHPYRSPLIVGFIKKMLTNVEQT